MSISKEEFKALKEKYKIINKININMTLISFKEPCEHFLCMFCNKSSNTIFKMNTIELGKDYNIWLCFNCLKENYKDLVY